MRWEYKGPISVIEQEGGYADPSVTLGKTEGLPTKTNSWGRVHPIDNLGDLLEHFGVPGGEGVEARITVELFFDE